MHVTSSHLRKWAIRVVLAIWSVVIAALLVPALIVIFTRYKMIDSTADLIVAAAKATLYLAVTPWFAWCAGGAIGLTSGFTVGVWLDGLLRRREDAGTLPTETSDRGAKNPTDDLKLERKELVIATRGMVLDILSRCNNDRDFRDELEHNAVYYNIRPHLSNEYMKNVDSYKGWSVIMPADGATMPPLASMLLEELDRLQKTWELL